MSTPLSLEEAVASLEEFQHKSVNSDLSSARTKEQMAACIRELEYSEKRMLLLIQASNQVLEEMQRLALKKEQIQTYKSKIINTAKELNMSYHEVVQIMADMKPSTPSKK
ncbi:hypothetical protein [Paraferrimonas haliotis]|uniref:Uncharacterized protein n=1 Tax=Paraferrimonas haliotis TaxID=2013866 RepID=A0AA37WXD4_9GAMM|nr:hypothetical protein [Paraferrimonas haliotis]GLS84483.1 hypothetical protein GCM10007894_24600 [Paraferrimonas haliotis]